MGKSQPDKLAQDALKKRNPKQAISYLSNRYANGGQIEYLIACIDIMHLFHEDIEFFHSLLWTIKRLVHTRGASLSVKEHDKILYKKLALKYFRFIDYLGHELNIPEANKANTTPKRLLIIGQQFLRPPYSITMCMLEFARIARIGGFEDIKLFITNEYPEKPASTFHESMWAVQSTVIGDENYDFKGDKISIHSHPKQGISKQSIQDNIAYIEEYAPDAVLLVGDNIILGDVCAKFLPTMCWPISQTLSASLAHTHYYRSEIEPMQQIDWKRLKHEPPKMLKQDFDLLTEGENQASLSRDDLKLPEDAFAFVLVGGRIEQEITPKFRKLLFAILEASPNAYLVIVGPVSQSLKLEFALYQERIRWVRFIDDLRSAMSNCDAFLNPPRQGGGNSAYWAMLEGLPILTLDDCDVQMTIREGAAVKTLEELQALAILVMNDENVRNDYIEKSKARIASFRTEAESGSNLMSGVKYCIEEFNTRLLCNV